MPHTDSDALIPDPQDAPMTVEAAQRVAQEKLTRRATLRKLGFGAGMAAFSLLGVDDFARMVGQRLQRNAHDNQTALAVAKEFQNAGIALASGSPSGDPCDKDPHPTCCKATGTFKTAYQNCVTKYGASGADLEGCIADARLDCGMSVSPLGCAIDNYCSGNY